MSSNATNPVARNTTRDCVVLFFFGAIGVLVATLLTYPFIIDDAVITLRYSYNLAHIGQPVWNQADVDNPTMGYTSTMWMVLNAIPALFTDDKGALVEFTRFFNAAIVLLLLGFVSRWIVARGYSLRSGLFLVFLFSWNPIVGMHVNSGMETILFGVLVFLFAYEIVERRNYFFILATGFACYLARPEGGVMLFGYWLVELIRNRSWKRSAIGGALLGAMLVAYHFAVARYYGDILPTPFYIKQATGSFIKMAAVKDTIVFFVCAAVPFVAITASGWRTRRAQLVPIVAIQVGLLAFFLTVEPLMNVVYRYQMPVFFLLYFTTLIAYPAFSSTKRWIQVATGLVLVAQCVLNLGVGDMYAKKTGRAADNLTSIGTSLVEKNNYQDWLAFGDAGFVCYYSDFNTVDMNRLNTKSIAREWVSPEQALLDPRVKLLLTKGEFVTGEPIVSLRASRDDGFAYAGSVPITRDSRRTVVVQFYARDAFVDSSFVAAIPTEPDYEHSWFQSLYYAGRKLLKNR